MIVVSGSDKFRMSIDSSEVSLTIDEDLDRGAGSSASGEDGMGVGDSGVMFVGRMV